MASDKLKQYPIMYIRTLTDLLVMNNELIEWI